IPLAARASARLDGLRHGRTAVARRTADGRLVPRRLVPAGDLQPQASDEEALAGDTSLPGLLPGGGRHAGHAARAPAVSRPRRNHRIRAAPGRQLNATDAFSREPPAVDACFMQASRGWTPVQTGVHP